MRGELVCIALLVAGTCATGCSAIRFVGRAYALQSRSQGPPNEIVQGDARVALLEGDLDRPVEVLALLDVNVIPTAPDEALAQLRHQARALDADAVWNVEVYADEPQAIDTALDNRDASTPVGQSIHLCGIALRYGDPAYGSPVLRVTRLRIVFPVGQEATIMAQLRERCRSFHGDYLADVSIHHPADGGHAEVEADVMRIQRDEPSRTHTTRADIDALLR